MAVGKKGKGGKKKAKVDCMLKKEWYDVVAPGCFKVRHPAKTCANKSHGQKLAENNLKGRVFQVNLADLEGGDENLGYRKVQLRCDHVQGRSVVTNFHGMSLTTDKLRSLVKKWCTLIEAKVQVRTSDGYGLRVFILGFTDRNGKHQQKKNCYAQSHQIRAIRQKMTEVVQAQLKCDLQTATKKLMEEIPSKEIAKACRNIFPLRDVSVRKVKITKLPKFDLTKLMDAHGGELPTSREDVGAQMAEE